MTTEEETDEKIGSEESGKENGKESGGTHGEMPGVDFSTFVLSLGTTALYQMGVMASPESGESIEADPLVAQQTIDTLAMLRDKTRGNLSEEERKLIESLLYELRMRFVELEG